MLSPELQKKIQNIYIKSRGLANEVFSGEYESAFRGRGMEFEEVREYVPGDDIRIIDWNVSARMNHPYVKIFREEREQTLMLVVDASASQNFGSGVRSKKEMLTEIAAVLAFAATNSNDKVGLLIFSDRVEKHIPPKKGRAHVWHVISEIMTHQSVGQKTDYAALELLNKTLHRRAICFVISDFLTTGYAPPLRVASFKHDVVAITLSDPLERELPMRGLMTFQDFETGHTRVFDFGPKGIQNFGERQKKRQEELAQKLRSMNLDVVHLSTDVDYIDALLKYFRIRERRI